MWQRGDGRYLVKKPNLSPDTYGEIAFVQISSRRARYGYDEVATWRRLKNAVRYAERANRKRHVKQLQKNKKKVWP